MKTRKFNKKLALNKRTVSKLNTNEMNAINGGASEWPCATYDVTYCVTNCVPTQMPTRCYHC